MKAASFSHLIYSAIHSCSYDEVKEYFEIEIFNINCCHLIE